MLEGRLGALSIPTSLLPLEGTNVCHNLNFLASILLFSPCCSSKLESIRERLLEHDRQLSDRIEGTTPITCSEFKNGERSLPDYPLVELT